KNLDTDVTCNSQTSVTLKATSQTSLACAESFNLSSANGYASAYVSKGDGDPVLAIRQAVGAGSTVTAYYFKIILATSQYVFYKVDANGPPHEVHPKTIPGGALAKDFVLGILYKGKTFTFYINGQPVGSDTDTTFSTGGFGLCVDHGATS